MSFNCSDCALLRSFPSSPAYATTCMPCYLWPGRVDGLLAVRCSRRLAAKAAVNYYEAPVPSEAEIRAQDMATEAAFVRAALKAKRNAEAAADRNDRRKAKEAERAFLQLQRDLEREVFDLPPPPPLRRTCQLPSCDEWCSYCRENDRIAAVNCIMLPPPTHLPVIRMPIAISAMTAQEVSNLIATLTQALHNM